MLTATIKDLDFNIITENADVKEDLLDWQKRGLRETASGYGSKLTTTYKVLYNDRWFRVYCTIFSNCGTLWIKSKNKTLYIDFYEV